MRLKYWNLEEISDIRNKIILGDRYLAVRQDNLLMRTVYVLDTLVTAVSKCCLGCSVLSNNARVRATLFSTHSSIRAFTKKVLFTFSLNPAF